MTLRVSDHAVLRYLERVGGFDIGRLRNEIAQHVSRQLPGRGGIVTVDGVAFVVRDDERGKVVTTTLQTVKPQRHRARKWREVKE